MTGQYFLLLLAISSSVTTAILLKLYKKLSYRYNLLSKEHALSFRSETLPNSAGLIIAIVYSISIYFFLPELEFEKAFALVILPLLMSFVGFIDDSFNLSSLAKLLFQSAFVASLIYILDIYSFIGVFSFAWLYISLIFIFLAAVWMINTFNFIDGADGLLAINIIIISAFTSIMCLYSGHYNFFVMLLLLACLTSSFLCFNWHPATLFMGDSGSLFFGLLFVSISLQTIMEGIISFYTWLIILSILYIDTSVTLITRLIKGEKVFKTRHNYHAYQQLIIKNGHSSPAKASIIIQTLWIVPMSVLSFFLFEDSILFSIISIAPMAIIFYFIGPRAPLSSM